MNRTRRVILGMLIAASVGVMAAEVGAAVYRQRYSSWSYYPQRRYYYRKYYYKPYTSYTGYQYHYCIHYPTRPNYVYYYNPVRRTCTGGDMTWKPKGYSMLAEKGSQRQTRRDPRNRIPQAWRNARDSRIEG